MTWVEEAEEHLRIVAQAEKRRHAEEIARLTFELERLRAERDALSLRAAGAELRK